MSDMKAMASSALAMSQSDRQQQIEMLLLRMRVQADRKVVDMINENAERIAELSKKTSTDTIDLYV